MNNFMSVSFQIKLHRLGADGRAPIYARITINSVRLEFTTNRTIEPIKWDMKKTTVDFELTNDAVSRAADRFMLVLGKAVQPVLLTTSFSIKLSPNPTSNILHVTYEGLKKEQETALQIISAEGKIVQSINLGKTETGKQSIFTQSLSNGLYIVQLINGDSKQMVSFIKN